MTDHDIRTDLSADIRELPWVQHLLASGFAPVLTTGALLSKSSGLPQDHMVCVSAAQLSLRTVNALSYTRLVRLEPASHDNYNKPKLKIQSSV